MEFFANLWRYARQGEWRLVSREFRHWDQRRTRGWDDVELWNLDQEIAKFILPRLKEFKRQVGGPMTPGSLCPLDADEETMRKVSKRWNVVLDDMIAAFEILAYQFHMNREQTKIAGRGLRYFSQFYYHLWW